MFGSKARGLGTGFVSCENVVPTSRLLLSLPTFRKRQHQDHHLQAGRYTFPSPLFTLQPSVSSLISRLFESRTPKEPQPHNLHSRTMSPLARSPVLSALARTRIQRPAIQKFRTYAAVRSASAGAGAGAGAGPGWAAQWKKVGGSAMM